MQLWTHIADFSCSWYLVFRQIHLICFLMVCSDTDLSLWMNFHAECVLQVEGVEKIYIRYQNIVSATKSKTYDILDHRKLEVTLELEKSFFFCSSTALQKIHIMCVCVSV